MISDSTTSTHGPGPHSVTAHTAHAKKGIFHSPSPTRGSVGYSSEKKRRGGGSEKGGAVRL